MNAHKNITSIKIIVITIIKHTGNMLSHRQWNGSDGAKTARKKTRNFLSMAIWVALPLRPVPSLPSHSLWLWLFSHLLFQWLSLLLLFVLKLLLWNSSSHFNFSSAFATLCSGSRSYFCAMYPLLFLFIFSLFCAMHWAHLMLHIVSNEYIVCNVICANDEA